MKHKLKRILKLNIFVLGMLIVLTNCQTEDLVLKNETSTKSRAIVTKLNYEQFLKQQNVKSTVEKLKKIELIKISNSKHRSNTQRAIVTIDSSSINQVIKEGVVSYTFKVLNSDLEANTFENLVIQTDTTQQTNAYLIKYIPSISLGIGVSFQGIKEVTPLDSSTTISTTNKTTVCVSITTYTNYYWCDEGVVQSPETCEYRYTTENTETSCETLPDGNSNSTVFYSNPSSGGGGTTGGNDSNYDGSDPNIHGNGGTPINTAPLFDENAPIDHVAELKKLTNNKKDGTRSNIKTRIDQLHTSRLTSIKENGYMFDKDQNTLPSYNQGPNWTAWANSGLPQYYITLHMHQDFYIPEGSTTPKPTNVAPSDTDVVNLLLLLEQTDNKNVTSMLVNRLGTFAIRVTDKSKANNTYNALTNPSNKTEAIKFGEKYDELVITPYETIPLDDNAVMDGFIQFINTHLVNGQPMGLSLYQAVYDSAGNIINWVKL